MFQKWNSSFPCKMQALTAVHVTDGAHTLSLATVPTAPTVSPFIHVGHQPRLQSMGLLPLQDQP